MVFQKPKGTEDFLPEDMNVRNKVFSSLRSTAERFGFLEISSPAFETLGLLTKKEGEEIKEQIFTLEKRSKEEFGLRFDLTVPITRMFVERQKAITKPVKWFAIDRMWRYEQPQKGRLREFYQLSVEMFGSETLLSDAEIINLALTCLTDLGLTEKDIVLRLSSRKILQELLLEIIPEKKLKAAMRIIDKRTKLSKEAFFSELKEEGIDKGKELEKLLNKNLDELSGQEATNMKQLLKLLGDNKKFVEFDLSTARGLAYYTGTVFEVFDKKGEFRAILGGGRYDNLVEQFGGQKTPATGFAIGYTTLSLLLEKKGLLPEQDTSLDYFVLPLSEEFTKEAVRITTTLRKKYKVGIDVSQRNFSNQMKYAKKIGAKKVVLVGEDEIKTKKFTVKDLTSGKEEKKTLSSF